MLIKYLRDVRLSRYLCVLCPEGTGKIKKKKGLEMLHMVLHYHQLMKVYLNMYGNQYLIGVKGHENAMILRKMAEKMNELEDLKNNLH